MKVTTSRSKSSETFYICHSFVDKNGKNTSRVHKRLGTLAELSLLLSTDRDGVMAWAKEQARIATDDYNKENQAVSVLLSPTHYIPKNEQRSFNCGYLFLQSIISSLRFDNICRNIKRRHQYEYNLYDIFSDLAFEVLNKQYASNVQDIAADI